LSFFKNSAETTKLESIRQYQVETDPKNTVVITRDLDIFQLNAASYILVIDPVSISGTELMKLLEIQLIRVD
jgi:hypothetical protein